MESVQINQYVLLEKYGMIKPLNVTTDKSVTTKESIGMKSNGDAEILFLLHVLDNLTLKANVWIHVNNLI